MSRERMYYAMVTLVVYALWIVAFKLVGEFAATLPTHDPTSAWDQALPFVPLFIWPYELCYIIPLVPVFLVKDGHRFNRALVAIAIANVSAFVVYLLFPVAFDRPVLGSSLSERVLAMEFAIDFYPGANKLPSLHVAFAWLICILCQGQTRNRVVDVALYATAVLITVSTLFVKQHILVDAVLGVAWAWGSWALAGYWYARIADLSLSPSVMLRQIPRRLFGRPSVKPDPAK